MPKNTVQFSRKERRSERVQLLLSVPEAEILRDAYESSETDMLPSAWFRHLLITGAKRIITAQQTFVAEKTPTFTAAVYDEGPFADPPN